MTPVKSVRPMSWTRRSAAETFQRMVEARHKQIGNKVAELREAQGWSQETLAQEAGVSVRTVSRLENGIHEGRGNTMRLVAKALKIDVTELLMAGGDEGPARNDPESQLDRIEAKLDEILLRLDAANIKPLTPGQIAAQAANRRGAAKTEPKAPGRRGKRDSGRAA